MLLRQKNIALAHYNNSLVVSEPKIRSFEGSEPLKKDTNEINITTTENDVVPFILKNQPSVVIKDCSKSFENRTSKKRNRPDKHRLIENYNFNCSVILKDVAPNRFISKVRPSRFLETSIEQYNCRVVVEDFMKAKKCVTHSSTLINLENACGNGAECNVKRCGSRKCMFQHKFLPKDKVVSSVTHRVYDCVYPSGATYTNCHSSNVIYLITCSNCHLQYVDEISQKLNERFGNARSCNFKSYKVFLL